MAVTTKQADLQYRPIRKDYLFGDKSYLRKSQIRIQPIETIVIKEPDHRCLCIIVWRIGEAKTWRELKYIHKCCPIHGKIPCVPEYAG